MLLPLGKVQVRLASDVFNRIDMDAALLRSATTTPLLSGALVFGIALLVTFQLGLGSGSGSGS